MFLFTVEQPSLVVSGKTTAMALACRMVCRAVILVLLLSTAVAAYALDNLYILPSVTELTHRIEQVESDSSLAEEQKAATVQALKKTVSHLETIADLNAQSNRYQQLFSRAASEQAALTAKLAAYKNSPLADKLANAPLTKLDTLLAKEQLLAAEKRQRSGDIATEINQEKRLNIPVLLEQAREQLQKARQQRDELATTINTDSASRLLAIAYVNVQLVRIEMLEQRLLSRNPRLQLLDTEQQLLSRQIADTEARILTLQNLVSGHRESEAERILAVARQLQSAAGSSDKALATLAAGNVGYAQQLKQLVASQDQVLNLEEGYAYEAKRFEQKYSSLNEQLNVTQLESSPAFGAALRKQRDKLVDLESSQKLLKQYERELTQSRLAQFQIDIEREPEAQQELSQALAESGLAQSGNLADLLSQRESLLNRLSSAYSLYIGDLSQLIGQLRLLKGNSKQYTDLLDQQLIWMPSTDRLGLATLTELANSLPVNSRSVERSGVLIQFFAQVRQNFVVVSVVLLVLVGLMQQRRRLIAILPAMKDRVGKVNRDSIRLTFTALLITLLLALPGPLLLQLIAQLLNVDGDINNALWQAFSNTAALYFVLAFVSQSLRSEGLAERHFEWDMVARQRLKTNLSWLKWSFLPLLVVVQFAEFQDDAALRDSLGRIAFIAASVAAALFFYRAFNPRYVGHQSAVPDSFSSPWQFRYLIYPLLFWPPLILGFLAAAGYYYSAMKLAEYWMLSLFIVVAGFYLVCVIRRVLAIGERRLALDRAREKRAAALEETPPAGGNAVPLAIDLEKIDLQTISTQTDALLKMIAVVSIGALLWNLWSEFFSAFQRLDKVSLWQISEMVNGSAVATAITVWDLLLTVAVVVITFLAARNIPGLLEITVLSRLSLQTGTSYTVTTICRYIIVITGTVIALQLLGAQWSKLQWLIAALSVGIGFGLQEIVANFVSGLVILFERPIRIGDTVTVGDQFGTVSRIRIRATTIVDWDRREVIIPNKTFITEQLINWTLTDPIMRTIINVGVAYGSDVALVEKTLMAIAKTNKRVLEDPPAIALFRSFGESSLDFQLRVFIKGIHELNPVIHEINIAIDREFKQLGIEIAFPQRDLHIDSKPIEVRLVGGDKDSDGPPLTDFENDQPNTR